MERVEARDLFDVAAVLCRHPELTVAARRLVHEQDALLLSERLLAWADDGVREDLRAYPAVPAEDRRGRRSS